jgi:hypothetical protein
MSIEDRDTVVVENDRGGSGMGMVLGIIAILVLLVAIWFFAMGPGTTTYNTTNNNGGNAPAATQQAPASS